MQITIRITWRRMILGGILAALLVTILMVRLAFPAPNTVIGDRNSIRARLAIPSVLREFPVEDYATEKDWFVYRRIAGPRVLRYWKLHIACIGNDANKWCLAFRKYLGRHGGYIERGGDATFTGQEQTLCLHRDQGDWAFVSMENHSGNLQITFNHHKAVRRSNFWNTKIGIYVARILLKLGVPPDAITCPS